jgi:exodeoxyribonuclease-3
MEVISIATLNIGAAAKERAERILSDWVIPRPFDVYVFTETSEGEGTKWLRGEFERSNWLVFQRPCVANDRGVLIATRVASVEISDYPKRDPAPGRTLGITLTTSPEIELLGVYVPNRGNDPRKTTRKRIFLESWMRYLEERAARGSGECILVGDMNVVPPSQHPTFLPQQPFEDEWYRMLTSRAQMVDAALIHNETGHESTWKAFTGEGYTYDHIFMTKSLTSREVKFSYDHSPRIATRITDHSAVVVSIRLEMARFMETVEPGAPVQGALF